MFKKNNLMKFLAISSVVASGLSCLNAHATLEFSEKTEDRSPYSFLSDDEYSKIKDFDEIKDLAEELFHYGAIDFDKISRSKPFTMTIENDKFKYTVSVEQRRGFKNFLVKDIFVEDKEVPFESASLSELSKEKRKELIEGLKKDLKSQIILKVEETVKNYKNKKIIKDDENSFECLFTISPSDVEKIIEVNNANQPNINACFYCPISIKINKENGQPKELVITSVNKNSKAGNLDNENMFISNKYIDTIKDLEKYFYDIALVFKNFHDSFEEDKNIQSVEDIIFGLKKEKKDGFIYI